MARDFNQNRNTNAKLGIETIDKYGKTFAVQFGLDGFSAVNNVVQPAPSSIIPYLEGNISIKQYAVPINVDELCNYALASFPNIEELTLFSLDIVSVEDHLSYLSKLKIMYVNQNNLSSYSWFPTTIHSGYESFTSVDDYIGYVVVYNTLPYIVTENNKNDLEIVVGTTIAYDKYLTNITVDYTYEIKDYTQDHKLTSDIVTEQLNDLTSQQRNAITKLVIANSYTSESANGIAWTYDFSVLPNLNNNIWYGTTQIDFSTLTIEGSGTLTSAIVESSIASISSDKLSLITKVVIDSGFTGYDKNCFGNIDSGIYELPNVNTIQFNGNLTRCITTRPAYSGTQMVAAIGIFEQLNTYGYKINHLIYLGTTDNNIEGMFANLNAITNLEIPNLQNTGRNCFTIWSKMPQEFILPEVKYLHNTTANKEDYAFAGISGFHRVILPKAISVKGPCPNSSNFYIYLEKNNVSMLLNVPAAINHMPKKWFVKAEYLECYMTATNWSIFNSSLFGYLDYTDTIPTFSGYTDTWYSDEDCTTPIATTDFVSGNRYYVKLQAI